MRVRIWSILVVVSLIVSLTAQPVLANPTRCDWWDQCAQEWEDTDATTKAVANTAGNIILGGAVGAATQPITGTIVAGAVVGGVAGGVTANIPAGEMFYNGVSAMEAHNASEGQQMVDFWRGVGKAARSGGTWVTKKVRSLFN